jgi:hypothetical protein
VGSRLEAWAQAGLDAEARRDSDPSSEAARRVALELAVPLIESFTKPSTHDSDWNRRNSHCVTESDLS